MKGSLKGFFNSFKTTHYLLIVVMLLLAAATVVEKYCGIVVAREWFYHSPLLFIPIILLCINFLTTLFIKLKKRGFRISFLLTHLSFIFIILGAIVTHYHSFEGVMNIREGERTNGVAVQKENDIEFIMLPFSIELNDFVIERYPGSSSPSSYCSYVTVYKDGDSFSAEIYMNNVLQVSGYRFYQMSFDKDEHGTILSINYDPIGRPLTYIGYILLAIGLTLSLFNRHGRIAKVWRDVVSVIALLIVASPINGAENNIDKLVERYKIDSEHAAKFGELAVLQQGRVMPMRVFANQIVVKLTEEDKIYGLNGEQFMLAAWTMPELWSEVKVISVGNDALAKEFGLPSDLCSFSNAFNTNGEYKLASALQQIYEKDVLHRDARDKAILALDERFNIFSKVMNGDMLKIFPLEGDSENRCFAPNEDLSLFKGKDSLLVDKIDDWYIEEVRGAVQSGEWEECNKIVDMIATFQKAKADPEIYSERVVQAELIYDRIEPFSWCKIGYLLFGVFAMLIVLFRCGKWVRVATVTLVTGVCLFHVAAYAVRCYIAGYVAMSNSYETMILLSLIIATIALLLARRNFVAFALGLLFAGVILFVSGLSWNNPQITPLVPVLKSTWLMFHVAFIMAGYSLFGFSAVLGLANIVQMAMVERFNIQANIKSLTRINELSMWIGLILTAIGIFMGAVWADNSWGRYWGWDPKETWALITMLVYVGITHLFLLNLQRHELWLNLLSVLAIAVVIMTYFGVNVLFSGMHSYG